jgi:hypothetical protein
VKQVDRLARLFFDYEAKLALRTKVATAYQDHFNDLMEGVHNSHFIRVRPAGSVGDRKCDGYLIPADTVFQVYAPTSVKISVWTSKIADDFDGARAQWDSMRSWIFVHNQHEGLPPDIAQAILTIKEENPDLIIDQWPPSHLLELTVHMQEDQLIGVFGYPPRDKDMRTLHRGDIAVAVAGLARESESWKPGAKDLPTVDPRKLDYNSLSEHRRRLITAGIAQTSMVEGYFDNNPDPNLRDRAAMLMKNKWHQLRLTATADDAFDVLFQYMIENSEGSRALTASLALLAHLFEACDIFDSPPLNWHGIAS